MDTTHDVSHTLALALRDAGKSEEALPIFLEGRQLSEVVDPEELDEQRGGAYYVFDWDGRDSRAWAQQPQLEVLE